MAKWEGYRPFRAWLERELAAREWKPIDLARRINPEAPANVASSISRWMLGKRQPDPVSCAMLSEILGVDLDMVLELAGHRPHTAREEDELVLRIAAGLRDLPRAQQEMIDTTVRALHDELTRRRLESSGQGGQESKSKSIAGKASKAGNGAMVMAPIEVLIAAEKLAPYARRLATLGLMLFGISVELGH